MGSLHSGFQQRRAVDSEAAFAWLDRAHASSLAFDPAPARRRPHGIEPPQQSGAVALDGYFML
jgi:hypothetical protein